MVAGQQHAVRFLVCNITRLHASMSRTDAQNAPSLFVPELKTLHYPTSLPFGEEVEIFSAIRMREKYYLLPDCLGRLCLAGYNRSGDGRMPCLILFRSHPARRRGYGPASQTCSVQVGREKFNQSGNRPSYIIDSSP